MDALLQFASVFCTEIEVEKHFDPPRYDFWRGLGGLTKFSRLAIARHILGPLMNYAVIRPLVTWQNLLVRIVPGVDTYEVAVRAIRPMGLHFFCCTMTKTDQYTF